jgi:hypothetical protein
VPILWCCAATHVSLLTAFRYGQCLFKGLQCVNLSQCPAIERQVPPSSSFRLVRERLKDYICGRNHRSVRVCCPKDSVTQPTPEPRATGTLPDTSLVRHRNFKLINRNCGVGLTDRIVGGLNASPGEFPWLAVLQYNGKCTSLDISSGMNASPWELAWGSVQSWTYPEDWTLPQASSHGWQSCSTMVSSRLWTYPQVHILDLLHTTLHKSL